jgi:hypothetical protein
VQLQIELKPMTSVLLLHCLLLLPTLLPLTLPFEPAAGVLPRCTWCLQPVLICCTVHASSTCLRLFLPSHISLSMLLSGSASQ